MSLSRNNWKAHKRQPKSFPVASLGGESVLVRPISAKKRGEINKSFADDGNGRPLDSVGFSAAFIAQMIVDEAGETVFTEAELVADDFDDAVFQELARITGSFIGIGDEAKNSTAESSSPSV